MPRQCTVCGNEKSEAINEELINGTPYRTIADRYNVSKSALIRHRKNHLPEKLAKAKEAEEVAEAEDLLEQVEELTRRTTNILDTAEEEGDLRTALKAIREARQNLDLLAKLQGQLQESQITNIIQNEGVQQVVAQVVAVVKEEVKDPKAARRIAERLQGVNT